jgi:hypothetical protein
MFNNALQYSSKDGKELILQLIILRNQREIKVDIINLTDDENNSRIEVLNSRALAQQPLVRGAGVDTNILLFHKMGGNFSIKVDYGSKVIASSRIDLEYLKQVSEGGD